MIGQENDEIEVLLCNMDEDTHGKVSPKDTSIPANRYNTANLP